MITDEIRQKELDKLALAMDDIVDLAVIGCKFSVMYGYEWDEMSVLDTIDECMSNAVDRGVRVFDMLRIKDSIWGRIKEKTDSIIFINAMNKHLSTPTGYKNMGHVYAIEKPDNCVKIGYAKDPIARLKALQSQGGFTSENIYISSPVENPSKLESKLHNHFKGKRLMGEWFDEKFSKIVTIISDMEKYNDN